MRRFSALVWSVLIACSFASVGCRSQRLIADQGDFRSQLLSLYTDQLIDNLIRARRGLPIIHIDYTNFTGTITDTGNAGIGFTSPSGGGSYMGGGSRVSQLTVTGNPVISSPDVYYCYLAFLKIQDDSLIESPEPPPQGAAHVVKCVDGIYYWIPASLRKEFLDLAIRTIARGEPPKTPQGFLTTIAKASVLAQSKKFPDKHRLLLTVAPYIPEDHGYFMLKTSDDGPTYKFKVNPVVDPPKDKEFDSKNRTNMIELHYSTGDAEALPLTPDKVVRMVTNRQVEFIFTTVRPQPPAPSKLETVLQSLLQQNQLSRLQAVPRP